MDATKQVAEIFDKQQKQIGELKDEVERLETMIFNFCANQTHGVDSWRNQDHIKPLFDEWEKDGK